MADGAASRQASQNTIPIALDCGHGVDEAQQHLDEYLRHAQAVVPVSTSIDVARAATSAG